MNIGLQKILGRKFQEHKGIFVINSFKNLLTNRE